MVEVAKSAEQQRRVDLLLNSSERAYEDLAEVVPAIRDWDDSERMGYVYDWLAHEERMRALGSPASQAVMTPEQRRRYEAVKRLAQENEENAALVRSLAS